MKSESEIRERLEELKDHKGLITKEMYAERQTLEWVLDESDGDGDE